MAASRTSIRPDGDMGGEEGSTWRMFLREQCQGPQAAMPVGVAQAEGVHGLRRQAQCITAPGTLGIVHPACKPANSLLVGQALGGFPFQQQFAAALLFEIANQKIAEPGRGFPSD